MSDSWDNKEDNSDNWEMPNGMDPMKVMQVASAYWDSCALHAAVKLDVFNKLDGGPKDLDTLTKETESDKRCLGALLSAIVSMGFLDRDGDTFMNNEMGNTFLTYSSKFYQGGIVGMFANWYEAWGGLYDTVKTGKPSKFMHQESYTDEETRNYMTGMHNRALSQSQVLTEMFDLSGKKKIMDVGCGPATFAVMFCKRYEGLNAVAMDRNEVLVIAKEIVAEYKMEDRVELLTGDYNTDTLGTANDAMLLSSITNQNSPEGNKQLFQKCYDSMNKDGVIMVQEQLLWSEKKGPKLAALIGVNQIINTVEGLSYSTTEMEDTLRAVGFEDIKSEQMAEPSPFIMVSGYRR